MASELLTTEIKQIQDLLTTTGITSIKGRVFFSSQEQGNIAFHARFFIDDYSQEEAKTSKFRFAMQELLDKIIINRSKAKSLEFRQGVIEFTDEKVSLKWLELTDYQAKLLAEN